MMMSSYCLVFMHPHTRQTVMIPAAPEQPLPRWARVGKYLRSLVWIAVTSYL